MIGYIIIYNFFSTKCNSKLKLIKELDFEYIFEYKNPILNKNLFIRVTDLRRGNGTLRCSSLKTPFSQERVELSSRN